MSFKNFDALRRATAQEQKEIILAGKQLKFIRFKCTYCGDVVADLVGGFLHRDEGAKIFTFCGPCGMEIPKMLKEMRRIKNGSY